MILPRVTNGEDVEQLGCERALELGELNLELRGVSALLQRGPDAGLHLDAGEAARGVLHHEEVVPSIDLGHGHVVAANEELAT